MKKTFPIRLLLLALVFALSLPFVAEAKNRTLVFKNVTGRQIQFAIVYRNSDGQWMKSGWYIVRPHGEYLMDRFVGGDVFYVFGTDQNRPYVYTWPPQNNPSQYLKQSVRQAAFTVRSNVVLDRTAYFTKVPVGKYARYTWTFK